MKPVISFRMDDISPAMNWSRFNRFVELFNKYELCPLLGLIPDNQYESLFIDPPEQKFWQLMRTLKSQGWSISQHGYQHTIQTDNSGILGINQRSEFAGLSYDEQYRRIIAGKKILAREALETDIWMAPFHSYDAVTLEALKQAGFKFISDGQSLRPYQVQGLKFMPCQMETPRLVPFGVVTVCIHSNFLSKQYFDNLEVFLRKNRKFCVNYFELVRVKPGIIWMNVLSEKAVLLLREFRY